MWGRRRRKKDLPATFCAVQMDLDLLVAVLAFAVGRYRRPGFEVLVFSVTSWLYLSFFLDWSLKNYARSRRPFQSSDPIRFWHQETNGFAEIMKITLLLPSRYHGPSESFMWFHNFKIKRYFSCLFKKKYSSVCPIFSWPFTGGRQISDSSPLFWAAFSSGLGHDQIRHTCDSGKKKKYPFVSTLCLSLEVGL